MVDLSTFQVFSPATLILLSGPRREPAFEDFPLPLPFFRVLARGRFPEVLESVVRFLALGLLLLRFLGMARSW